MKKQIIFLLDQTSIPSATGNGNRVLVFALCNILIKLNYKLNLIFIDSISEEQVQECLDEFKNTDSITIKFNRKRTRKSFFYKFKLLFFRNKYGTFFQESDINNIQDIINNEHFDLICAYDIRSIVGMNIVEVKVPRIAFMVDLIEEYYRRRWERWKKGNVLKNIRNGLSNYAQDQNIDVFYNYLKFSNRIVEHAFNHSIELQERGFQNVSYLPHPLPKQMVSFENFIFTNNKYRILIVGSFKGVASQLGHELFLDEVLPHYALLNQNELDTEFRFVGHGVMRADIKQRILLNPSCNLVGFVEDLVDEWKFADIVLVTIPIEHGFRTRIAEAMSYGKCVIAHIANSKGMPELEDGYNCILAKDGVGLAEAIYDLKFRKERRRILEINAINTFNSEISAEVAIVKLDSILRSIGERS